MLHSTFTFTFISRAMSAAHTWVRSDG